MFATSPTWPSCARVQAHEKTKLSGPGLRASKGRAACASATYGGCYLWYARIADQKPIPG
ncbi:hypothetical protein ACRAWD_04030 [Caulobacter segnis]